MSNSNKKIRVLFVCLGNICRSPMSESVFNNLVKNEGIAHFFEIQSAGTANYHVGEQPDNRTIATLKGNGITDFSRAQLLQKSHLQYFDFVLAMDKDNLANILLLKDQNSSAIIRLFRSFGHENENLEVPDPYYGNMTDFSRVFDMVEEASYNFLTHLRKENNWIK